MFILIIENFYPDIFNSLGNWEMWHGDYKNDFQTHYTDW